MKILSFLLIALSTTASAFAADLIVCTREVPQWTEIMNDQLGAQSRGPALIINLSEERVTWMGSGSYVRLTGVPSSRSVKITRIDGRASAERILSQKKTGRILDLELADSLGGIGLLRISMNSAESGKASWQHATDSSKTDFAFCTTNVLQ